MEHTYKINGMTCSNCEKKVYNLLKPIPGVLEIRINRLLDTVSIKMSRHIHTGEFERALEGTGYILSEDNTSEESSEIDSIEKTSSFKPIYLIFGYITAVSLIIQIASNGFDLQEWFRHYMAAFFLVFSFFKMLDISAFASSYSSYDIIAKRIYLYGYIYPFIELALGIGFLFHQWHSFVNIATMIVMSVSLVGVIQSILQKRTIQCACLGAFFKLPLSKITLFEDALMILMSLASLTLLK